MRDTDKSRYFAITEFTYIGLPFDHQVKSLSDSSVKRSAIFHTSVFAISIMHTQNIIYSKTP